ncbi:MAG TPA: glycosyltransferase N-terminal domain-containing protein [Oligoflexia bacterium]|nr:glycosyltransferase N-terminal domain-containing protein [Oligoflexia bacterium]HMP27807.1 glycosyltransferase N-terminal domain-containing protein [Oligoflexia bacterium]
MLNSKSKNQQIDLWVQGYSLLARFLAPFVASFLLFDKNKRKGLKERFGYWTPISQSATQEWIWLHCASVGELKGFEQLIPLLKEHFPTINILITTTTATGKERAAKMADAARLLPFDSLPYLKRSLQKINLKALIIAETELWPCLFYYACANKIPIFIINGRISDRSYKRYQYLKNLLKKLLNKTELICVGNEQAASRYKTLGAPPNKIILTGSSKYDLEDPHWRTPFKVNDLISQKRDKRIMVLGSIRPGEEQIWFPLIREFSQEWIFFVAPRHPERFTYFKENLRQYQIEFDNWSLSPKPFKKDVILVDTIGVLRDLYAIADLAFIGGTLVPIGGHDPVEALARGVPIILGPYVSNIQEICQALAESKILFQTKQTEIKSMRELLSKNYDGLAEICKQIAFAHKGASQRIFSLITERL